MMSFEKVLTSSLHSASSEVTARHKSLELLRNQVLKFGYEISCNVPYDGNCFFHAMCHLLLRTNASDLRQELLLFLKSNDKVSLVLYWIQITNLQLQIVK